MMAKAKYIHFDWAAKRLLRQKANFVVEEDIRVVVKSVLSLTMPDWFQAKNAHNNHSNNF